ncbi:MAG: glycosyltransferase [Paludibacter sp.]
MLSIIICSRKPTADLLLTNNIKATIGVEYELVFVDNSKNRLSIFSAYNEGIKQSKFPYLCFIHDDVNFLTNNWGKKIIAHLSENKIGLAGLAGGDAMLKIPFDYGALNRSMNIIHVDKTGNTPKEIVRMPKDFHEKSRPVVLLDGVLLCSKRSLFDEIKFDETIGLFHGYDLDISMQSYMKGYTNLVMYDISVQHFSKGKMDTEYFRTIKRVYEKWKGVLPVFERKIPVKEIQKSIVKLEEHTAKRLLKWLVRSRMPSAEIAEYFLFFIKNTSLEMNIFLIHFIRVRILFMRILSTLRNKNIKKHETI